MKYSKIDERNFAIWCHIDEVNSSFILYIVYQCVCEYVWDEGQLTFYEWNFVIVKKKDVKKYLYVHF
jgi:hypothetical protein